MKLTETQQIQLRALLQEGLPFVSRPYQQLAEQVGSTEQSVIDCVSHWQSSGLIKRMGLVVNHKNIGYTANAMVVWDVAQKQLETVANKLAKEPMVTLCYQRPRRLPQWPYNLFCMIHGTDKATVLQQIEQIVARHQFQNIPREVLFSYHQFKQCGGKFVDYSPDPVNKLSGLSSNCGSRL